MVPGGFSEALCGHFLARARKWLQEASLELSGLGLEIAPGGFSGAVWGHFVARARNGSRKPL
eukprot:6052915-Karenia_brevis.AAC.1